MRYSNDRTARLSLGGGEYLTVVQPQAAAAVMDYHTGELVAIVGGREEPVQKLQLQPRLPEQHAPSALPSSRWPSMARRSTLAIRRARRCSTCPSPSSTGRARTAIPTTGGGDFTGSESLRYAINRSHNTAAAQALMTYVGIENSVAYLLRLGRPGPYQRQRRRPGAGQLFAR